MRTLPFIWLIWLKEDRRCSLVILKRKVLHKFRLLLFLIADHVTIELPVCLWSLCDFLWSLCDLIRIGHFQSFDSFPVFSWLLFLEAEKLQFLFFKQGPRNILMSWQVILFSYFLILWSFKKLCQGTVTKTSKSMSRQKSLRLRRLHGIRKRRQVLGIILGQPLSEFIEASLRSLPSRSKRYCFWNYALLFYLWQNACKTITCAPKNIWPKFGRGIPDTWIYS